METEDTGPGAPSSVYLFDLLQTGNLEYTVAESQRVLRESPEDENAHFCLALAYSDLDRLEESSRHVDFLLKAYPEESNSHLAAVFLAKRRKRWSRVRQHAREGMRLAPEEAIFHFYAGLADMVEMKFDQARQHVSRALELDPDDPDTLNLSVRLSSIYQNSPADAWNRVGELRDALKNDPANAALHQSLGDTFLDELDLPREAEHHYREALRSDPNDRDYQKALFHAVAKRDLVYRLLSIPSRTFTWVGYVLYAIRYQPWRLIFLIIGFKIVIVFFCWLALVTVLFWPACKIYEWLMVSELKAGSRASIGHLKTWRWFHRWPRAIRFGLFLLVFAGLFAGASVLLEIPLSTSFPVLGVVTGVHFAVILFGWLIRVTHRKEPSPDQGPT